VRSWITAFFLTSPHKNPPKKIFSVSRQSPGPPPVPRSPGSLPPLDNYTFFCSIPHLRPVFPFLFCHHWFLTLKLASPPRKIFPPSQSPRSHPLVKMIFFFCLKSTFFFSQRPPTLFVALFFFFLTSFFPPFVRASPLSSSYTFFSPPFLAFLQTLSASFFSVWG